MNHNLTQQIWTTALTLETLRGGTDRALHFLAQVGGHKPLPADVLNFKAGLWSWGWNQIDTGNELPQHPTN